MLRAEDVGLAVASHSRAQGRWNAAELAGESCLSFQPQVRFPVQLKLQMVRKCAAARLMSRTASGAISNPAGEAARLHRHGEPLPGMLARFGSFRSDHRAA
jgi:hypothetical protein